MRIGYTAYSEELIKNFIKTYADDIVSAIKGTGLYFAAVVAQKCYESSYGNSVLASKYNNFGGIKNYGSLPNAGIVYLDTTEVINGVRQTVKKAPFATYANPRIAFQAYVDILRDPSKKYTSMGVFSAISPEDQITRIAKAGYTTTNPSSYLKSMQGIVNCVRDLYPTIGKIAA